MSEPIPYYWSKRLIDIVISLCGLLLLLPFIILVLVLIFLENIVRGHPFAPLFYTETRISAGEEFRLIKFSIFNYRYLKKLREKGVVIHTKQLEKNGGVTRIGWILKQIYMDELPQLYNVLVDDMSLVGPRPLNLEAYEEIQNEMREKGLVPSIELIKGGMTGFFQSYKGLKPYGKWHTLDQKYLHVYTSGDAVMLFLADMRIVIRTVKVILRAKGV